MSVARKDWCTDKDPWRWERCGDCGAIIGKDYGSFSHMCEEKRARLKRIKETELEEAKKFKEQLSSADTWSVLFEDRDGIEMIREVPISEKRLCWIATDCSFVVPYYVELDGKLFVLNRDHAIISFKGRGWTKYTEIVPEVVL